MITCISDDHSRVVLEPYPEDVSSDYVNANYMDVSQQFQFHEAHLSA